MLFDSPDDDLIDDDGDSTAPRGGVAFEEPDALPLPRMATRCLGHDDVESAILKMINGNTLPQAMVFAGLQGIGKATFAYRLIKFLCTHKPEPADAGPSLFGDPLPPAEVTSLNTREDDPAIRLVLSGGHPDFLVLERKFDEEKGKARESVDVEQVRTVAPFLQKTPSMGGWRIVLIDDADTMTRNSQNALLKVLEEPPANTILILIAHRPGNLIPTIRSRTRYFSMTPPPQADFDSLIKRAMPTVTTTDLQAIHTITGGSIGAALRMMEGGGLKSIHQLTALLQNWPTISWADVHMMGEVLGGKGNDDAALAAFQDSLMWVCEHMAKARATGQPLAPFLNNPAYRNMLTSFSLDGWAKLCEYLRQHFLTVKYGTLDKRQAVFGAVSILKQTL